MAPELFDHGGEERVSCETADSYAFGVTMLETLYPGLSVANETDVARRVVPLPLCPSVFR